MLSAPVSIPPAKSSAVSGVDVEPILALLAPAHHCGFVHRGEGYGGRPSVHLSASRHHLRAIVLTGGREVEAGRVANPARIVRPVGSAAPRRRVLPPAWLVRPEGRSRFRDASPPRHFLRQESSRHFRAIFGPPHHHTDVRLAPFWPLSRTFIGGR